MEQKRQNKQKRRAAFTLAEFLTVIAIVGILASLSFVAVIHYQRSSAVWRWIRRRRRSFWRRRII